MQKISGVSIEARFNEQPLVIEENGYMGKLTHPGVVKVKVRVSSKQAIYAISVDGRKNITRKKNYAPANSPDAMYNFNVQIKGEENGNFHTHYPENNMRLIKLNPDGNVEIWQIAVIAQSRMFFLITEKTYDKCVFRNDQNQVVCPQFKHRPTLTKFLKELLKNHIDTLLPITEYTKTTITANGLKPGTGRVRFYNAAQGWGLIITPEGVARVHRTEIAQRDGLAILYPGETVRYKNLVEARQTSNRYTEFEKEAYCVDPL